MVAKSAPDGYTLAMLTGGFATQAAVLKNLQYEPLKDFVFITSVVRYPMVYTVRPDSPIKSFKDMIERAKAAPGKVSYGIVGAGNVYHLLGKWIDNAAGVEMNAVPYRGTALALQDVLGGRVDVLSDAADQHHPARLERPAARARGVVGRALSALAGRADHGGDGSRHQGGILAGSRRDRGTPRPIVDRLNSEFRRALELPEVKKWAEESGVVPAPSTRGIPRAGRERRPAMERDRRPQQHQRAVVSRRPRRGESAGRSASTRARSASSRRRRRHRDSIRDHNRGRIPRP